MDRMELVSALTRVGAPDSAYEVPGFHELPRARPEDYYYLRSERGAWVVGAHERGQDRVYRSFDHEDQACRYLYGRLTGAAGPQEDSDQVEAILANSEEIQRHAWEQFRRATDDRTD